MKKNLHIISRVLPDSIGEELELEGDGRRYAPLRFEDPQPRRERLF